MKKLLVIFICFISALSFAQDEVDEIRGDKKISGSYTTENMSFSYDAKVNYRFVLFGGVKFDFNLTDVKLRYIRVDGKKVPNEVYKALNLKQRIDDKGSYIFTNEKKVSVIDRPQFDVITDVVFWSCFGEVFNYLTCKHKISNVKIVSVGWGTFDEYTYLDDDKVKLLKNKFDLKKAEDFYDLDATIENTKITKFTGGLFLDIKNEMDKLRNREELIAEKIKALKALEHNKKLTVEKLKYKKKLIEELMELDVKDCSLSPTSCKTNLEMVEAELKIKLLADTIKELKTLTPNTSLSLEKLERKKEIIENIVKAGLNDCMTKNSCSTDLKNVEQEIEKRYVAKGLPELIKVTGGTFTMGDQWGLGDDGEQPTHQVTLTDYYIGKTEVTVAQYRTYCNATGISMPEEPYWGWNNNDPIINVNWNDAINYCAWLSKKLGKKVTLPTEAQWEYAARGGANSQGYKYSGANSIATSGWYSDNSGNQVHPVATKKANELGLYDMSGNVWEWCFDWYDENYYANSPSNNPKKTSQGYRPIRVFRGGSFGNQAAGCRVAGRNFNTPTERGISSGFRVVSF